MMPTKQNGLTYRTSTTTSMFFSTPLRLVGLLGSRNNFLPVMAAVKDAFIRVLSAGGSDYPHEILLNEAGLDMTKPEAYEPVRRRMVDLMDRIEALL